MKPPYTLHLTENGLKKEVLEPESIPAWISYPLHFSQKNIYYHDRDMEFLRQEFSLWPFYIDLAEFIAGSDFELMFRIEEKQLFLFFMLAGNMAFYNRAHQIITHTSEDNFLMSYYCPGQYYAHVESGNHIALVVNIHPDWLETVSSGYQNIVRILDAFKKEKYPYQAMYQEKIDRNIYRWIRRVYNSPRQDVGILDGLLRMNMSCILKHYDAALENHWLPFDVREFILQNLTNEDLGIKMLCKHFRLSERVLRYQFMKAFGESVQAFYTQKRMDLANKLIQQHTLAITDVYSKVGYKDESTFRYHYNKHIHSR